jgi:hypothetical protein
MPTTSRDELRRRIDLLERCYELQLAYAAQGVASDADSKAGGELRALLGEAEAALDGLAAVAHRTLVEEGASPADATETLVAVLERDAATTRAAIRLVLARVAISSQLIDNLNASIHVRALLTDLFLLDELTAAEGRAGAR